MKMMILKQGSNERFARRSVSGRMMVLKKEEIYIGPLVLVNREHPIQKEFTRSVRLMPFNDNYRDILLDTKTNALLSLLLKSVGVNDEIVPVSGYRTSIEQRRIYYKSLIKNGRVFTEKFVALPDHSEHRTGFAIDLAQNSDAIDFICPDFPYTGICGAFRQKAADYGFIERYPKGREAITGIAHEPWHFRFVGYPHSKIMQNNDLTLEEYILFIKDYPYDRKHFRICEKSKEIEVFYVKARPETTEVILSEDTCYQISGNNVDGFIVTIWR